MRVQAEPWTSQHEPVQVIGLTSRLRMSQRRIARLLNVTSGSAGSVSRETREQLLKLRDSDEWPIFQRAEFLLVCPTRQHSLECKCWACFKSIRSQSLNLATGGIPILERGVVAAPACLLACWWIICLANAIEGSGVLNAAAK